MYRLLVLFLTFGLTFPLSAQEPSAQVWLSLRGNYTQSFPKSPDLTAAPDWAVSYGTDVMFAFNGSGRLRYAVGLGFEITNVNTVVEHGFIVNEGFANEMVVPDDINVRTRLTNLSVPMQLNWFTGEPRSGNEFFVFLRSDLLIGLGASSGEVEVADGGLPPDQRLRQALVVTQADIAHLLGFGVGWEGKIGARGNLLRLQPMVRFSTLDLLNDSGVIMAGDRLNYLRATDVLEFGLNISFGF